MKDTCESWILNITKARITQKKKLVTKKRNWINIKVLCSMKFREVFMSKFTLIFISIDIMLEAIC